MAAATARRTRRTQGQEQDQQGQPQTDSVREDVDTATGEVTAPAPAVSVDAVPVTYYRPSVTMPDGRVVVCAHKYLHETEKAAAACGRRIAANGEFVK